MKYLFITFLIFAVIYLISFYKRPRENFSFFDREYTSYIKGLAIFLVILSHMGGSFGIRYLTPLGGIGVAMFLICSGYGLSESYKKKGLTNYWQNKITYTWFPYFLLQSIVTIIAGLFSSIKFDLSIYLKDILLINYQHPLGWYLQFAIIWYFIFYIVHKMDFFTEKSRIVVLALISFVFIFSSNELWAEQAFSFFTGTYLSYKKDEISIKDRYSVTFSLLFIGIFFLAAKQIDVIRNLPWLLINVNQLLIKLPLALGLCLFVYQVQPLFKNNMFVYFSKFSFSLYLIHGYTLDILNNPSSLKIVAFLVVTFILSILLDKILNACYSLNLSRTKAPE